MILHYIGTFKLPFHKLQKQLKYFNHYQTLKVQPNATEAQIKTKFKHLAKLYHPDNNPNQDKSADFIKIRQAYDCLKDYNLRRQYDRTVFPQRQNQQAKNFYYYRTEQSVFEQNPNPAYEREYQRRRLILFISNITRYIIFGMAFYYLFAYTLVKTEHQIRRQNIILSGENIDSGPSAIQRRRKQYSNQMKQKKIYGKVVQLKVKGGYQQSTRAKTARKAGISSIEGIKKQNQQIIDFNERVQFM